ncbi:hyperosmotically inducible protein [Streptomyces sp. PanSC19]|uniref:BON domain-containing protein n=1 Tax=Streptomyces sp. PanSC19 TaxID=1520455 RepID=UPI000F46C119|nr:BON domain-containing protein [Streptomyces sp. PanSC19]ROQ31943.1 hyperosmotically inducible protein [Streptomyces sp. PanSC19]
MANTVDNAKQEASDTWITTKVKADLMTEKGIPGGDIKVETSQGVVALSSDIAMTWPQIEEAVRIAKNIKGVQAVMSDGLKAE